MPLWLRVHAKGTGGHAASPPDDGGSVAKLVHALDGIEKIESFGGMVEAIEQGYPQREIAASSYRFSREMETKERVMVGVNAFDERGAGESSIPLLKIDEEIQRAKPAALKELKAKRDVNAVNMALERVRAAAKGSDNLMPPIIDAAKAWCSQQEICDVLREVLGTYTDPAEF